MILVQAIVFHPSNSNLAPTITQKRLKISVNQVF